MKRLLIVVPYPRFFITHRLALAEAARSRGYDVSVATAEFEESKAIAAKFPWFRLHWSVFRQEPLGEFRLFRDLLRIYRTVRPDVVHHVTLKPVLYGTLAARLSGVRAVVNAMPGLGDAFGGKRFRDRLWARLTTILMRLMVRHRHMRMIVQNDSDRAVLEESGIARSEDVVMVRGSGVDPDVFVEHQRDENPVVVVALIARLVVAKGVNEFVDAARILKSEGVRARFVVAGEFLEGVIPDTISRDRMKSWVGEGLIEYLGYVDDPRSIYAMSDIVALPSYREGLPKTLLEA